MSNVAEIPSAEHSVVTGTDVCPDLVDETLHGRHRSAVVRGNRVWWFENKRRASNFLVEVIAGSFRRAPRYKCSSCFDTGILRDVERGETRTCSCLSDAEG